MGKAHRERRITVNQAFLLGFGINSPYVFLFLLHLFTQTPIYSSLLTVANVFSVSMSLFYLVCYFILFIRVHV